MDLNRLKILSKKSVNKGVKPYYQAMYKCEAVSLLEISQQHLHSSQLHWKQQIEILSF